MRKKIWKKAGSLLMAAVMAMGICSHAALAKEQPGERDESGLIAWYQFAEDGKDSSGHGNDALIGEGVTVSQGVASLPGGKSGESAYITLPKGMFDGRDELTITMWLKDEDPRDNWLGAFFFGSPVNENQVPVNYFYFVPCEKQHETLKAVITDSVNAVQPYSTEKGIRESVQTKGYVGNWTHYAIVLKPGSLACYINGRLAGASEVSRTVSDFGSGLEAYIGKSNYTADPLYQGKFKDFRVYGRELGKSEITEVMSQGHSEDIGQYSMDIDGEKVTKELSADLYGLFYEDINSAADGGLYPEMVKNYSFENAYVQRGSDAGYFAQYGYETIGNYKLHWDVSPPSAFEVKAEAGINAKNPHYAVITGNAVLKNGGFAPQSEPNGAAMPVKPDSSYTFSAFARADSGYEGVLKVKAVDSKGNTITEEKTLSVEADGTWKKVSVDLASTVKENTKGKIVLSVEGAKKEDSLCLDMISLVPHDSYGYGNMNYACGVGVRKDLLERMIALNPKFMRFPGGCIVEGFNWEGLYDWRDTIGALEERKSNTNRWENWNNQNRTWGYMQSYGFGYHELLCLCEDFGMEPFPILSAGVLCQYETADVAAKTGEELNYFIRMATDLLDYCWGDPKENEWAEKRAKNGHEQPFDLKYLGIGNENFQAKYFDNLDIIKQAVEDYAKTNYPQRNLTIISSAGPTSGGENLEYAYDRLAQTMPGETLVDEHYYESESFMYNQSDRYNYYQRTAQGGSDIFVGEYAVKDDNKFHTALAEAAYITGLERNADVVKHISYAPLLYKTGSLNWSHDLIYFDEFDTAGSANYYVQQMFGTHYGTKLIDTKLQSEGKDYEHWGSPVIGADKVEGSIDKITVYGEDGNILFEDDFDDISTEWALFDSALDTKGSASYTIKNGKLNFDSSSGTVLLYLPRAIKEKWSNYRIVAEGVKKTFGNGGFMVGAGQSDQYYWYHLGKDGNSGSCMEVTRKNRGESSLTRMVLGNQYPNQHYQTENETKLKNNDNMSITFVYGVGGKLEGSYTSTKTAAEATQKYDFSSDLFQYQTDIYQVVNMDEDNVYIKLVNPDAGIKEIKLTFHNLSLDTDKQAEITMLTGGLNEANSIGRETVAPEISEKPIENETLIYDIPAYSVNVIQIPLKQKGVKPEPEPEPKPEPKPEPGTEPETNRKPEPDKVWQPVQVKISKSALTMGLKEKLTVKASVLPAKASQKVTWRSSKPSVASVSAGGKITAKKTGSAVITATAQNGISAKCKIKVKKAPKKLSLNKKAVTLKKGRKFQIRTKLPKNTASYKITFKSGKKSVAAVTAGGKVVAKKKGTAIITVKTFNGVKAKIKVRVR